MALAQPIEATEVTSGNGALTRMERPSGAVVARVAAYLVHQATPGIPLIVGVTALAATHRSELCNALQGRLRHTRRITVIPTSVFLRSGASVRPGSSRYDYALMSGVLQRARWGPVEIADAFQEREGTPLVQTIDRPDILIVEGLGLPPARQNAPKLLDVLIAIEADDEGLRIDPSDEGSLLQARNIAELVLRHEEDQFSMVRERGQSL